MLIPFILFNFLLFCFYSTLLANIMQTFEYVVDIIITSDRELLLVLFSLYITLLQHSLQSI